MVVPPPGRSTKHLEEEIKQKAKQPVTYADEQSLRMIEARRAKHSQNRESKKPLFENTLLLLALVAFIFGIGYLATLDSSKEDVISQSSIEEALVCVVSETELVCE